MASLEGAVYTPLPLELWEAGSWESLVHPGTLVYSASNTTVLVLYTTRLPLCKPQGCSSERGLSEEGGETGLPLNSEAGT